jgi:AcrR family transcriptional regulator
MARPRKYDDDTLLGAALTLLAERGPAAVTVPAISNATGAPSGSIYHRFHSRDLILARLWVRTTARFQQGYLAALDQDDLDRAAVDAALHVVQWTRSHPTEATVLLLHRRSELADTWPGELGHELAGLEAATSEALADHARRRYGAAPAETALHRVTFALVDVPYAACRRPLLAGQLPADDIDQLVTEAVRSLLGITTPNAEN